MRVDRGVGHTLECLSPVCSCAETTNTRLRDIYSPPSYPLPASPQHLFFLYSISSKVTEKRETSTRDVEMLRTLSRESGSIDSKPLLRDLTTQLHIAAAQTRHTSSVRPQLDLPSTPPPVPSRHSNHWRRAMTTQRTRTLTRTLTTTRLMNPPCISLCQSR